MINLLVTFPPYLTYPGWQINEYSHLSFSTMTTALASHHEAYGVSVLFK